MKLYRITTKDATTTLQADSAQKAANAFFQVEKAIRCMIPEGHWGNHRHSKNNSNKTAKIELIEDYAVLAKRVEISTREYELSHGKKPSGTGSWAFAPIFMLDEHWFAPSHLTYAAASKLAREHFAMEGVDHISACP